MASLREIPFRLFYRPADKILETFYIPALKSSVQYDRSAGYFRSSALAAAAAGVAHLIQNDGRMRLLVGADLDPDDVEAIRRGEDLRATVTRRILEQFPDPEDALLRQRLEVLAWMVASGTLEVKVVLPLGPDRLPIPGPLAQEYYHTKKGIFTDAAGNQVAFVGSVNESAQAWMCNYEELSVYISWEEGRMRQALDQVRLSFEQLWQGKDRDWVAIEITPAVRERLIRYKPRRAPARDPVEAKREKDRAQVTSEEREKFRQEATLRERIIFQFLRDAPRLLDSGDLAAATSAVEPWPHQLRVARVVASRYPEGSLLCDEVGLGKTIEAGLVIRTLLLSGRVRRCLILTPKSVLRQWQEELYEKFGLDVPRYDGGKVVSARGQVIDGWHGSPWSVFDVLLASSQLAKRRERLPELEAAPPWDLLVVDEAHHARRKDFRDPRYRPNRLLTLLERLRNQVGGLMLVTATPMQIHPIELWDLLVQLGMGGAWAADEENFLRYFRELRKPFDAVDWDFVLDLVHEQLQLGMAIEPAFAREARRALGAAVWRQLEELPARKRPRRRYLKALPEPARPYLHELARRHTPLSPYLFRSTRNLLRQYVEKGLLKASVPARKPRIERVPFTDEEFSLYRRIDEYITSFYHKYESERRGLGFVMTVYRRRLTSSFYALRCSLERRLQFLEGRIGIQQALVDDDLEQEDLSLDVSEEILTDHDRQRFQEELRYVQSFIQDLRALSTADSKLEVLKRELERIFRARDTVLIFTQYTDTMDYLRDHLKDVYGTGVACYSGRGGEVWNGITWVPTTKEYVKARFRDGDIRILVCTEAASEGLNLQTCGVLINYDMPWNPMRVEQRIGRIDRIGQKFAEVWISNYFYRGTIEDKIYQRLKDRIQWFEVVVGSLQPILAEIGETTRRLAMLPEEQREEALEQELRKIRERIEHIESEALNLDEYVETGDLRAGWDTPVRLSDLESFLTKSQATAWMFREHPALPGAYLLAIGGDEIPVTFNAQCFDEHPDTVQFLTYGNPLLNRLLELVPALSGEDPSPVVRIQEGDLGPVGWYLLESASPRPIASVQELATALDAPASPPDDAAKQTALELHRKRVQEQEAKKLEVEKRQRERMKSMLLARARTLLVRAALIEIALGRQPNLFDHGPYPVAFSPKAITGLQRHGYPWTALLKIAYHELLEPAETDSYFQEIRELPAEQLKARFRAMAERGREVLEGWRRISQSVATE